MTNTCDATTQNLALIGLLSLVCLGASFLFVLAALYASHRRGETTKPPYEGDAGDEQEEGHALYGLPAVDPRNFDAWLTMTAAENDRRRINVHNN